jgi:hypothetical protein
MIRETEVQIGNLGQELEAPSRLTDMAIIATGIYDLVLANSTYGLRGEPLMKTPRLLLLFVAVFALSPSSGASERTWNQIQSPHFTVLCNGSEKQGRDAAVDLERMRAVFMKALPGMRQDPNVPVIVFVTPDEDTFATLLPSYRKSAQGNKPLSTFVRGGTQNFIVLRLAFRVSSEYSLKYDYAGLMTGVNFPRAALWLLTGMAEFFALSEIGEDQAKVGLPNPIFDRYLGGGLQLPVQKLVAVRTSSKEYTDPEQRSVFEAESYGIVHYFLAADQGAHRKELDNYLQLLNHGKKQLEAAEEAFGDLRKLQDKMAAYYKQKGFPFAVIDLRTENYAAELVARTLPAAESSAWLAEYHLRFKRRAEAKPLIDAALAENPSLGLAHEAMGIFQLEQADYESALTEFSAAVAVDPSRYISSYYKGVLSSYWKAPQDIPPTSEQDFRRAIESVPKYPAALLALARLVVRTGGSVSEAATLAGRAVDAEPVVVRYRLAYANILLHAGHSAQAEAEIQRALESEVSPSEQVAANELLSLALACKTVTQCKPLDWQNLTSQNPSPPDTNAEGTATSQAAPTEPKVRGILRSLSCNADGRVATLSSGGKDLTFTMLKTTPVSWPDTFWLSGAYLDVCKHFAGEPAEVFYKRGSADASSREATAVRVQDRY